MAEKEPMGIKFFGSIDKNSKGEITSEYPAWVFTNHIDQLEEDINRLTIEIQRGTANAKIAEMKEEVMRLESKLQDIVGSKPRLSDKIQDALREDLSKMGDMISEAMFTRSEMQMGWADAHKEADRMSLDLISIDNDLRQIALACGIGKEKVKNGKVNRTDLEKMYKIVAAALDADTNTEKLRKDGVTSRTNGVSIH
jgi:uncharacterized membrane protein YheB (UPF0754 family)